ncbi:alpha/beta fold hydrolase [Streptomyces sp. NBC_01497]|uniref:alpha/beta fold hydrolase n=1 Tax=Streptomyces sp. NBC_01497 TaxID=2903885 RepID=UPI003FCE3902
MAQAATAAVGATTAAASAVTGSWRRAGLAGAAIGVIAASAAAGVAIDKLTVSRGMRRRARLALDTAGPYGTLRGTPGRAIADDGTALYYEVDETGDAEQAGEGEAAPGTGEAPGSDTSARPGKAAKGAKGTKADPTGAAHAAAGTPPVTVVFSHGYCLNQDSWHFQRADLRGRVRTVHWDQRSHGRSARGAAQSGPDPEPVTIEQLGRDLKAVIDAAAPEGPLVLAGHSMGGMTIMALADQYPDLIRERVVGVALVGTSSGRLGEITYGLPAFGANAARRVLPGVLKVLGGQSALVEKGRRATADLYAGIIKRYSFGGQDVDPAIARFGERMIENTPIDVVAEFYPAFTDHDKVQALAVFLRTPALILAGADDLITPSSHSEAIADVLPDAELVLVEGAGHLVMLEHPDAVTERLADLLARAGAPGFARNVGGHGSTAQQPRD